MPNEEVSLPALYQAPGNLIQSLQNFSSVNDFRLAMQGFLSRLSKDPEESALGSTPDGNAKHIYISHVEMTLDEYFFGLWDTTNFRWQVVQNEIIGSILLEVTHPVTGDKVRRTGAAAIQIMVDKFPGEPTDQEKKIWGKDQWAIYRKEKNAWAIDVANKKPNSLDMGFPKLKADCIKNAASSIGKLFGRDINRNVADTFTPLIKPIIELPQELIEVVKEADAQSITTLWSTNPQYHNNPQFLTLLNDRKQALKKIK